MQETEFGVYFKLKSAFSIFVHHVNVWCLFFNYAYLNSVLNNV